MSISKSFVWSSAVSKEIKIYFITHFWLFSEGYDYLMKSSEAILEFISLKQTYWK